MHRNALLSILICSLPLMAADNPQMDLLNRGMATMSRAGEAAQKGQFQAANQLMTEATADIDKAVALDPENYKARRIRGSMYAQFPPFFNKGSIAAADLDFVVHQQQFQGEDKAAQDRIHLLLAKVSPGTEAAKPDRFPKIDPSTSPIVVATTVTLTDWTAGSPLPATLDQIVKSMDGSKGLLGKHLVASLDKPGMIVIVSWWQDKMA